MPRPVIGLSCYLVDAEWGDGVVMSSLIPQWYVDVIHAADADVLVLPPENSADVLERLDGLVLAGGEDVDARIYGEPSDPTADSPVLLRDASELALYRRAKDLGMPVLGICRGVQLMAVAHGGSLIQHLPAVTSEVVHSTGPENYVDHLARFLEGSLIASLLGTEPFVVNSAHHQAVDSPGDLRITGWAQDGTVEVCEDTAAEFCIGVQWHPERPDRRKPDAPLLRAFVQAAQAHQRSSGRSGSSLNSTR
ncbi:MAG: gamma-glutamyl-gamma-aminobutyrate hydrolase family protein [Actinomycetota bacterium]|nr:gamma-glutamyl-gamma-aminobutyrate hydrolase family protein [Actinomycetota bacterium]